MHLLPGKYIYFFVRMFGREMGLSSSSFPRQVSVKTAAWMAEHCCDKSVSEQQSLSQCGDTGSSIDQVFAHVEVYVLLVCLRVVAAQLTEAQPQP